MANVGCRGCGNEAPEVREWAKIRSWIKRNCRFRYRVGWVAPGYTFCYLEIFPTGDCALIVGNNKYYRQYPPVVVHGLDEYEMNCGDLMRYYEVLDKSIEAFQPPEGLVPHCVIPDQDDLHSIVLTQMAREWWLVKDQIVQHMRRFVGKKGD